MFDFIETRRDAHWREQVPPNSTTTSFDQAVAAYDRYAIEELHKLADEKGLWAEKPRPLSLWERAEGEAPQPHLTCPKGERTT